MNAFRFASTALLACGLALTVQAQQPKFTLDKNTRSIAITATEHVKNMADIATVHVGFLAYGPDKDAAYANGSRVSNAIMDALRKAGVANDAIQSENQTVQQAQPYELQNLSPTERVQRAFRVQQSWTVRVKADDGAHVLDVATKAGANESGQIEWSLRDPNVAEAAAAAKAIGRARTQANAMAQELGVKLGVLLFANNEVEGQPVRPLPRVMMSKAAAADAVAPLAINPREIETSATVSAVFAIE